MTPPGIGDRAERAATRKIIGRVLRERAGLVSEWIEASTTRTAGTPASATAVPPTTKHLTPPLEIAA